MAPQKNDPRQPDSTDVEVGRFVRALRMLRGVRLKGWRIQEWVVMGKFLDQSGRVPSVYPGENWPNPAPTFLNHRGR